MAPSRIRGLKDAWELKFGSFFQSKSKKSHGNSRLQLLFVSFRRKWKEMMFEKNGREEKATEPAVESNVSGQSLFCYVINFDITIKVLELRVEKQI